MIKSDYLLATVFLISTLFLSANALLKCWRCSSDATNGAFCSDPFDPEIITDQQKYWSYVNCSYPYGYNQQLANVRPVCKKLVQEIYGKVVVSRSCFYEDISDPPEKCYHDNFPSYVRTIYCQTCPTDGCNGAPVTISSPIAGFILIPIVVAKCLLF